MVATRDYDLKMAIKWPNLNIFVRDKVYMLCSHKRNILCEYEVNWSKIVDSRAKKPSKLDKIAICSVCDIGDVTFFQKLSSQEPLNAF